jgi:hypothetical protein
MFTEVLTGSTMRRSCEQWIGKNWRKVKKVPSFSTSS